jgi:hypothetical protein
MAERITPQGGRTVSHNGNACQITACKSIVGNARATCFYPQPVAVGIANRDPHNLSGANDRHVLPPRHCCGKRSAALNHNTLPFCAGVALNHHSGRHDKRENFTCIGRVGSGCQHNDGIGLGIFGLDGLKSAG